MVNTRWDCGECGTVVVLSLSIPSTLFSTRVGPPVSGLLFPVSCVLFPLSSLASGVNPFCPPLSVVCFYPCFRVWQVMV